MTSWEGVVGSIEHYLGKGLLMHGAVSSGSASMVTLILDLYDQLGYVAATRLVDTCSASVAPLPSTDVKTHTYLFSVLF